MLDKVILFGYSGHGYVVAEVAIKLGLNIIGYADLEENLDNPFELSYLGSEDDQSFTGWKESFSFILGVGSNKIRAELARKVREKGLSCRKLVHPNASVSEYVEIGDGSFIARNVAVNPLVKIGKNVILNTSCSLDHECIVGDNVHIAPGAVLAGSVKVAEGAFIGANSVVKEGVSIGKNAIIGAGSVIIRDVKEDQKVAGNPARLI